MSIPDTKPPIRVFETRFQRSVLFFDDYEPRALPWADMNQAFGLRRFTATIAPRIKTQPTNHPNTILLFT
jgi:hypothetical protein